MQCGLTRKTKSRKYTGGNLRVLREPGLSIQPNLVSKRPQDFVIPLILRPLQNMTHICPFLFPALHNVPVWNIKNI